MDRMGWENGIHLDFKWAFHSSSTLDDEYLHSVQEYGRILGRKTDLGFQCELWVVCGYLMCAWFNCGKLVWIVIGFVWYFGFLSVFTLTKNSLFNTNLHLIMATSRKLRQRRPIQSHQSLHLSLKKTSRCEPNRNSVPIPISCLHSCFPGIPLFPCTTWNGPNSADIGSNGPEFSS